MNAGLMEAAPGELPPSQTSPFRVGLHLFQGAFAHQSRIPKITASLCQAGLLDHIIITAVSETGSDERETLDPKREVVRFQSELAGDRRGQMWRAIRTLELTLKMVRMFGRRRLTLITCHSLPLLPVAVTLAKITGASLVYSPHELETEWVNSRGLRRAVSKVAERALIRAVSAVIVVSPSIAAWYRENYKGISVAVVRNIPSAADGVTQKDSRLRKQFGIGESDLVFLYQGGLGPGRAIPLLLRVFGKGVSPSRHLVIMGKGPHAVDVVVAARVCKNIHFMPMVAARDSGPFTAGADIGLNIIENICMSYFYSLGNKLFEYINSGVPVLVSRFPDMREIVEMYQCGWSVEPTEKDVRDFVSTVTPTEIARCRAFALTARKRLNWESEEEALLSVYRRVLEGTRMTRN